MKIQENVESSSSDDSSADEAERRKSAGKPRGGGGEGTAIYELYRYVPLKQFTLG